MALIIGAVALPLLGGLAYAFWSNPASPNLASPNSAPRDNVAPTGIETDLEPGHFASAPLTATPQSAAPLPDTSIPFAVDAAIEAPADAEARIKAAAKANTETVIEAIAEPVIETAAGPAALSLSLEVASGDTLMGLLVDAGIARGEAHQAITVLRDVFDPRKLKIGQEINLKLASTGTPGEAGRLLSLSLRPNVEQDILVSRGADDTFTAKAFERPLLRQNVVARGTIENNLSLAAQNAGVPMPIMIEMIRIFSFDVDFQRELQPGDSFEVLYQALFEANGTLAKTDSVLHASLTLSGKRLDLYNFMPESGIDDFFDATGQSVRKTLMRTPIDGARLSSRFGMRRHPVLGYSKMHQGTDFAAPRGTPIYAAGDGVIDTAGRNGGYGKYVRIRHNSTYKTAYAHMSRIAKGMSRGKRVRQGQIIGYVGSTGRSTGQHLHYEVIANGRQVNPLNIKLPSGEKLKGANLKKFSRRLAEIENLRTAARESDTRMAQADCTAPAKAADASQAKTGC